MKYFPIFMLVLGIILINKPADARPEVPFEAVGCMALNLYHEARGENETAQRAVNLVVINRVLSDKYPNTFCGVIKQGTGKKHKCQFSWYCDGKSDIPYDAQAWLQVNTLAWNMMVDYINGNVDDFTDGAMYYHTIYVSPKWSKHFHLIGKLGDHFFYKEK